MSTREKILIASKELFLNEGFRAPTLNLLAQKVGISRGNLTYYFKDKEALSSVNGVNDILPITEVTQKSFLTFSFDKIS